MSNSLRRVALITKPLVSCYILHDQVLPYGRGSAYSPKCVEGGFCELRLNGVLRSSACGSFSETLRDLSRRTIQRGPCLRKYACEQSGGAHDVPPSKEKRVRRITLLATAIGVAMLLASGVALAATFDGTDGPDTFVGTDGPDDIRGRAGNDNLSGAGGIDRVRGDGGNDTLSGGPGGTLDQRERVEGDGGNDTTSGDGGADEVRGGLGDDDMLGGGGADFIRADEAGIDEVSAGIGADVIEAHDDAGIDTIDCGDGVDTVDFDAGVDVVAANCENLDPH